MDCFVLQPEFDLGLAKPEEDTKFIETSVTKSCTTVDGGGGGDGKVGGRAHAPSFCICFNNSSSLRSNSNDISSSGTSLSSLSATESLRGDRSNKNFIIRFRKSNNVCVYLFEVSEYRLNARNKVMILGKKFDWHNNMPSKYLMHQDMWTYKCLQSRHLQVYKENISSLSFVTVKELKGSDSHKSSGDGVSKMKLGLRGDGVPESSVCFRGVRLPKPCFSCTGDASKRKSDSRTSTKIGPFRELEEEGRVFVFRLCTVAYEWQAVEMDPAGVSGTVTVEDQRSYIKIDSSREFISQKYFKTNSSGVNAITSDGSHQVCHCHSLKMEAGTIRNRNFPSFDIV
ncbi:hypothetical protein C0J52_10882 [Blattella germanica]|nr:hypothetical protein C0J52_10882 [Blattella germanica]